MTDRTKLNDRDLPRVLANKGLAQFGDALLNFAYSLALTETTGEPKGTKIPDKVLADAAVQSGLRKHLARRVSRGEVANGLEALLGHAWLQKTMTLEEIVDCLKTEQLDPSRNFSRLALMALSKLSQHP